MVVVSEEICRLNEEEEFNQMRWAGEKEQ
jgi:hypothetical protein